MAREVPIKILQRPCARLTFRKAVSRAAVTGPLFFQQFRESSRARTTPIETTYRSPFVYIYIVKNASNAQCQTLPYCNYNSIFWRPVINARAILINFGLRGKTLTLGRRLATF